MGTTRLGQLDGENSDASGTTMHQHALASLKLRSLETISATPLNAPIGTKARKVKRFELDEKKRSTICVSMKSAPAARLLAYVCGYVK
ncbi:MAG: hypothetical protein ACJ746_10175 [Bryobacteraceae bacterium]